MLSNIFKERYGKLLIGFCFVLLLMYLGDGWKSQKAWHQQERYLTSEEFIKDFNENREYYVKSYKGETPVYFDSATEYRDAVLTISNESPDEIYYNRPYMTTMNQFVIVFLFIWGFLSFLSMAAPISIAFYLLYPLAESTSFTRNCFLSAYP